MSRVPPSRRLLAGVLLALAAITAPAARAQVLNETCTAVVLNRTAPVTPSGLFVIANVPLPVGSFRARVVCQQNGQTFLGATRFVQGVPNGVTDMGPVAFTPAEDPIPVSIRITSPAPVLTPQANGAQLVVTGTLVDGMQVDFTLPDTGTVYTISNTAIATISPNGFVTGVSSGVVTVTAVNEGVIATIQLRVEFEDDRDGDGIPDDYERANASNPGGANFARLAGAIVRASSQSPSFPATRVVDGNLRTSWFTNTGDAANRRTSPFIEIELPSDVSLAQIRMFGNREQAVGFDFFAGRFLAFDAAGTEVFNSGRVVLPPPDRDLAVPVDLDGIRRVRFVATEDESPNPGLSEIELISRPGGPGLDQDDPSDAALDFDGDGLTNLDEFNRGTSIFLNDTDGDRVPDNQELLDGSDPLRPDSDNDGLLDGAEQSPLVDTDNDGTKNLLDPDSDGDSLLDGVEVRIGLDPLRADSNGNGIPDNAEDTDADGIPNLDELAEQLDPGNPDTDGDGLNDGEEVVAGQDGFVTDPLRGDTDGDGMPDGFESRFDLDPTDPGDAAADLDGDGLTNLQESQLDTDPRNPDRAAPNVMAVEPANGSTNVPVNAAVVVRFSEPMRATSFTTATVQVLEGDVPLPGTVTPSADGLSVTFRPTLVLRTLQLYTVRVGDVRDAAGNLLADRPFTSTFTSSQQGDLVRPNVVRVAPVANAEGVPINSVVQIEFDEPVDPATVTATSFRVRDNRRGIDLTGALAVDGSGTRAFFTPASPLAVGTQHRIDVTTAVRDLAGNQLSSNFAAFFTTGFAPDTTPPTIVGTDPANGATGLPINTVVTVDVSEPLDPTSVTGDSVRLTAGATPVPASLSLLEGNRRIRVVSSAALAAGAAHRLTVAGLRDLAANTLATTLTVDFTTGATADIERPTIVGVNPADSSTGVVRDVRPVVRFNEALNPLTVNTAAFRLQDRTSFLFVPIAVTLDATRRVVTLVPSVPLAPDTQHLIQVIGNAVADVAGNGLQFTNSFFFTTGRTSGDVTAPTVLGVNPPDDAAGVPLNSRVSVRLSEPIDPFTLTAQSMRLTTASGPVAATLTIAEENRLVTLVPAANLTAATEYTLAITGLADVSGNVMAPFTSNFFSSVSGVVDNIGPSVSVVPPDGATNVSLTPTIVFTFSEPLNPLTIGPDTIRFTREAGAIQLPVTLALSGDRTEVTLTPGVTLQPSTQYRLQIPGGVRDVAGNAAGHFSRFTTTAGPPDTGRPTIAMITPLDGTTDVAVNTSVVLTFSEPVDPNTVTTDSVALLIDGAEVSLNVLRSADNTVAVLDPFNPLPAGANVTVLATDEVRDLAGNRLVPFASGFRVETTPDRTQPSVAGVRPANGATDVRRDTSVVLFFSEPVDQATADDAIIVADQGTVVTGVLAPSSGNQVEEFTPAQPFTAGGLADVFVTPQLTDTGGNALAGLFQSSFRLAADPTTLAPALTAFHPNGGVNPRNVVVTARFSEPMDPATFTPLTVLVRDNTNGLDLAGTMSLSSGGTLFRFVPTGGLFPSGHSINVTFTVAVRDAGGTALPQARGFNFSVSTTSETTPPHADRVSPPDGTTGVGTNAILRVRFDEPVNTLTVDAQTIALSPAGGAAVTPSSISISDNDQLVTIVPHAPLVPSTTHTVSIAGVTDRAGNPVVPRMTTFVTGPGPDLVQPQVLQVSPNGSSESTNAIVVVDFSEPVDPATVRLGETFRVVINSTFVDAPGTLEIEPDGRRVVFTPSAPLHVGTLYRVFVTNGIEDASGNRLPFTFSGFFTTGFLFDTTPPLVQATDPANGDADVPTNALIDIRMSEPIDTTAVTATTVRLARGGTTVTGGFSFADANRRIRFRPVPPLAAGAAHTLTITGLRDVAGNTMPAPVVVNFTTEAGGDLVSPAVASVTPAPNTSGVARNVQPVVRFTEPLNPLTVDTGSVQLRNDTRGVFIPVGVMLDTNRSIVTIAPDEPLEAGTQYRIRIVGGANGVADTAGNVLAFTNDFFFFTSDEAADTTPPVVVVSSPPAGATNLPVNLLAMVRFSEPLDPVSVNASTVRLGVGATPVSVTLGLLDGGRTVTLTPAANLAGNTTHTLRLEGVTDAVGNPLAAPFVSTFTTSPAGGVDNVGPSASIVPPDGATGISVTPSLVFTFTEPLNPVSVVGDNFRLARESGNLQLPVTVQLGLDLRVVTVTPGVALQPMTQYRVQIVGPVRDFAGNQAGHFSRFTTGAGPLDTTRPTVTLVTPPNGTLDVSQNTNVVLTFSEPVDPNTVTTETIGLVIDGAEVGLNVFRAADNGTVVLDPFQPLPAGTVVTLLATQEIRDLAGNRLVDFLSTFTTATAPDLNPPSVAGIRPPNGATDVAPNSSVVVFFTEPIAPSTATNGIVVSNDGAQLTGTFAPSSGNRVEEFTPATPFTPGALAEVFVTQALTDAAGNPLSSPFTSSFRLAADPATVAPNLVAFHPSGGTQARNVVVTARFSEPMNPATFTPASVTVRSNTTGTDVPGTRSLDATGTLFRFVPSTDWPASQSINVTFTVAVTDAGGTPLPQARGFNFNTGAATETVAPTVVRVSPPDGATDVGTNGVLRVRFGEPTNALTVDRGTIVLSSAGGVVPPCTISLSDDDQLVTIVPHAPLQPATDYTVRVEGVTDRAGNPVAIRTTTFRTGAGPDLVQPLVAQVSPTGDTEPVNAVVVLDFTEPIDPSTVRQGDTVRLVVNSTFVDVPGSLAIEPSGRRVVFTPSSPLMPSTLYRIRTTTGLEDPSGNRLQFGQDFLFTTGTAADTTAPTVVATDPAAGDTGVPTNASITVQLSEPLDPTSVGAASVALRRGATPLDGAFSLTDGNRRIRLVPRLPLQAGTAHSLTISNLRDVAGNVLAAPVVVNFTTGPGADLVNPSVTTIVPAANATGVARDAAVRVDFDAAVNPITLNGATFRLRPNSVGQFLDATVTVGVGRTFATLAPAAMLAANTLYRVEIIGGTGGVTDTAGNPLPFTNTFFFTTGP